MIDRDECGTPEGEVGPCEDALQDAGGVIGLCYGHYGEASDSMDDLPDWVAEACGAEHGFASKQAARAEFKAMYRHQWAMSHCREKAEHLLLNTQHAHSDSAEAQAAQYRAHCERRAAYARRCCSKAPHKPRRGTCAGDRKRPRGAARVRA